MRSFIQFAVVSSMINIANVRAYGPSSLIPTRHRVAV